MSKLNLLKSDVLILCGGLGTRFRAIRKDIPKSLAQIKGTPFIDIIINDLVLKGFRRIILATGHLSSQIELHIQTRKDAEYIFSREPKPLGTGGAIKFAERYFHSENILILNGDSYINFNFPSILRFHKKKKADMSILLSSVTSGNDYGHVILNKDNKITSFVEKGKLKRNSNVNAGVYLINRSLLENLKCKIQYSLEKECIPTWINSHRIFGIITDMEVRDIGTPKRFKQLQKSF